MEDHTLTALGAFAGVLIGALAAAAINLLPKVREYRTAIAEHKARLDAEAAEQRDRIQAQVEGRERKAYQDGFASGCSSQVSQITSLKEEITRQQQTIDELGEENVTCRELAAKQSAAIDFLDQTRRQTHDELVAAGLRKGPFLDMPVNFRTLVPDPEKYRQHQVEMKNKMASQIVEQLKEEAKKVLPPEGTP